MYEQNSTMVEIHQSHNCTDGPASSDSHNPFAPIDIPLPSAPPLPSSDTARCYTTTVQSDIFSPPIKSYPVAVKLVDQKTLAVWLDSKCTATQPAANFTITEPSWVWDEVAKAYAQAQNQSTECFDITALTAAQGLPPASIRLRSIMAFSDTPFRSYEAGAAGVGVQWTGIVLLAAFWMGRKVWE
ncbi:uncharacterized protein EV422DRAFT_549173, partial [Fimicolochytrium jonesii]|uniref:uncharacterized protein n=1 Tax=Fimicolochytrium jonesii TaxID=1396493 RepID=UPI0022FE97FE